MYITNQAQQQLAESTQQACISKQLHRTKSVSLAQLIMARWPEKRRQRKRRREPPSPDAQAHAWTAWRGSARAAGQELPGEVFTEHTRSTAPRRFHRRAHTPRPPRSRTASTGREPSEASGSEAIGAGGTRAGSSQGSPRRGSSRRIQLEEGVEDAEVQRLP
jgi:hypothetical protein